MSLRKMKPKILKKEKRQVSISKECHTRLSNGYRIIDYPIDLIGIIICVIGILLATYLAIKYLNDPTLPNMTSSAMTNIIFGVIGIAGYIGIPVIYRYVRIKKNACSNALLQERPLIASNPMAYDYKKSIISKKGKESYERKTLFDTLLAGTYCLGVYAAIQLLQLLIGEEPIFEVVAFDVYAFFISSAIVEEMLFRGFLTMLFQIIYGSFIVGKFKKYGISNQYEKSIPKNKIYLVNILSSITTGLLFIAFHTRYWSDLSAFIITTLVGISQAIFFCWTKSLTIIMLSHGIGNAMASRTFLQGLSSIEQPFEPLEQISNNMLRIRIS